MMVVTLDMLRLLVCIDVMSVSLTLASIHLLQSIYFNPFYFEHSVFDPDFFHRLLEFLGLPRNV